MKVAIPQFESRVSPHFDFASKVLIATVEDGKAIKKELHSLIDLNALRRSAFLQKQGVEVVICGGISNFSVRLLWGNGIKVVAMIAGEAEQVLDQFLRGKLNIVTTPIPNLPDTGRRPGRRGHCRGRGKNI
jgi:predicted Fe-Mo cluster-binding NifX family protein